MARQPVKPMTIIGQLSVGVTAEIQQAIEVISAFRSQTPSQYGRMAILNQLVNDGVIQHPAQRLATAATAAKTA